MQRNWHNNLGWIRCLLRSRVKIKSSSGAKVNRTYRMRSVVLKPEMPVLWGQKGGNVKFFALEHDTEFLIYEDLQPLPSLVLWALVETIPTHWHMESD